MAYHSCLEICVEVAGVTNPHSVPVKKFIS